MQLLTSPEAWIALVTLTVLEIVLGIDNIIFISILAGRLPAEQRNKARKLGLMAALVTRILLLLSLSYVIGLTKPLFNVAGFDVSGRDLVLIIGGVFLLAKATHEIHASLEGAEGSPGSAMAASFGGVIAQIMVLDIVFSLDSVITAVGMAKHVEVMVAAVVLAVMVMLWFSGPVSTFVERHPTLKMLALAFLVLIGVNLIAEGFHQHIPKGYVYFAMAFSVAVEMLNIRMLNKGDRPVHLHHPTP